MRIVLIILSLTAFGFVWWLLITFWKNGNFPIQTPQNIPTPSQISNETIAIETYKQQVLMEERLKNIEKNLEKIAGTTTQVSHSEEPETPQNTEIIPVSAKFLGKILPTIELTKSENAGIFDLRTFDNIPYTTYKDEKFGITVVASMLSYDNFLKNFQSLDKSVYTVNITKTFPFDSFFVNPPKSDSTVRIVLKVEAQTLLVSLPKSKFNTLKELILKKTK